MKHPSAHAQNFLRHPGLVKTLLSKTDINAADTVYDIGGGKGIIASALATRCRTVISVEIDPLLAAKLRQNLEPHANAVVYEADFLALPLPQTPYKVFSNIPFNLSADIVRRLTTAPNPPSSSFLIVQKQFADKLIPKPAGGNSQAGITLAVEFEVSIVHRLHPGDFYPVPRVVPVLLWLTPRSNPLLPSAHLQLFRDFVTYVFGAWKPSVGAALAKLFSRPEYERFAREAACSVDSTPSELNLDQWLRLFEFARTKPALERIVGGSQAALARKHSRHTKLHRTRF